MRKVMTGEQVAQFTTATRSPCPSGGRPSTRPRRDHRHRPGGPAAGVAGPPGHPPPGGRHRPGRAGAGLAERRLAGPGPPGGLGGGGAGRLAVLLAVLVHPVDHRPGAGQVAGLVVLPAPVGRGDGHLRHGALASGPDLSCRCSARCPPPGTPTGWPSGWSPASPRLISPSARRTWRTGSAPCCAGSAPHGRGRWCWSSSAATPWPPSSRPCPSPPTRISRRCRSASGRTACHGWSGCMARIC